MNHLRKLIYATVPVLLLTGACNQAQIPVQQATDTPAVMPDAAATNHPHQGASTSLGIDVSHFQHEVNWDEIKQAGISYAYSKATQGMTLVDPKYSHNREGTIQAGLYHGAYHFYVAGDDPDRQADLFIQTVSKLEDHAMPPVLDLEQGGMKPGINKEQYQQHVFTWLKKVEQAFGVRPVIYTNHPFGNEYLDHAGFSEYDLWIAEYGVPEPHIPDAWKNTGWVMWQRTEREKVEGAIGDVDHDVLKGVPRTVVNQ